MNFVPFGLAMNQAALPDADALCEQLERLAAIGVTWVSLGIPGPSRARRTSPFSSPSNRTG